jgi:hypothetical protein
VLGLVAGQVPLLVEIKSDGISDPIFCQKLAALLTEYSGSIAFMSFDPRVVREVSRHAISLPRGLVISEQGKTQIQGLDRGAACRQAPQTRFPCL